ncbi:transposase [Streptomyces sp. NPDC018057]
MRTSAACTAAPGEPYAPVSPGCAIVQASRAGRCDHGGVTGRHQLPRAEREFVRPLLPESLRGRKRWDDRAVLNGIARKSRTGTAWRECPSGTVRGRRCTRASAACPWTAPSSGRSLLPRRMIGINRRTGKRRPYDGQVSARYHIAGRLREKASVRAIAAEPAAVPPPQAGRSAATTRSAALTPTQNARPGDPGRASV